MFCPIATGLTSGAEMYSGQLGDIRGLTVVLGACGLGSVAVLYVLFTPTTTALTCKEDSYYPPP